jgi:LysR family transcriptional regulator for bpeEF and oprC
MANNVVLRDLNKLNTFFRVAERRSFTRAAQDLRTTPSVISKHVKDLEEALGFRLLNRSTHGVVLTEAGQGLLESFVQGLAGLDQFVADARAKQKGPHGTLRIQTIGEHARMFVAPVIARMVSDGPGLRIHHQSTPDLLGAIDATADVIVSSAKPNLPGYAELELDRIDYVICASPDYFRRHGVPQEPRALKDHNCIGDINAQSKEWPFKVGGHNTTIEVRGNVLTNSHNMARSLALDGAGVIRIPRRLVEEDLAAGRLVAVLTDSAHAFESIYAYHSKAKDLPIKTVNFLSELKKPRTMDALAAHAEALAP